MNRQYRIDPYGEDEFMVRVRYQLNDGGTWSNWHRAPDEHDNQLRASYLGTFKSQADAKKVIRDLLATRTERIINGWVEARQAKARDRRYAAHARRWPSVLYP